MGQQVDCFIKNIASTSQLKMTASPGQMREATLIGPDEKSLIFACDAATAKEAKRAWSASSGCSIEHIQLLLADGTELEDTAELPSGDVSVRYSLAGAGPSHFAI